MTETTNNVPVATDWLLTSVGSEEQPVIRSTYMVVSNKTSLKGTAFSLTTGFLVTNEHVVRDSAAGDLVVLRAPVRVWAWIEWLWMLALTWPR